MSETLETNEQLVRLRVTTEAMEGQKDAMLHREESCGNGVSRGSDRVQSRLIRLVRQHGSAVAEDAAEIASVDGIPEEELSLRSPWDGGKGEGSGGSEGESKVSDHGGGAKSGNGVSAVDGGSAPGPGA